MIKSILFDIDGTLVARGEVLPGAAEALAFARRRGLGLRFLTNITGREPLAIARELQQQGLAVEPHEIQTATTACVEHLRRRPGVKCHLIVPAGIRHLFDGLAVDDQQPDVVVISDIGEEFNYRTLNRAFLMLRGGAQLVVPQKGLYWFDREGPRLDCGAFIVGLEAASGKEAVVTGKPSPLFFQAALGTLGCTAAETLVIGDDVSTDVRGALSSGARSVLVGTGKYTAGAEHSTPDRPDFFLRSLDQLPELLTSLA